MLDTGWPKSVVPLPWGVVSSNRQNCTHALPLTSVPYALLSSSWSTVNRATWFLPSHWIGLRWLSSQRAAMPPKPLPSPATAASLVPAAFCFTETHRWPGWFTGSAIVHVYCACTSATPAPVMCTVPTTLLLVVGAFLAAAGAAIRPRAIPGTARPTRARRRSIADSPRERKVGTADNSHERHFTPAEPTEVRLPVVVRGR